MSELDDLRAVLSDKHRTFADEYIICLNGAEAARKAGYSAKSAKVQASKLLTNPNIEAYIRARMDSKDKELIASQDEVLQYLTSVMRREHTENVVVTITEESSTYEPDGSGKVHKVTKKQEIPQIVEIPSRLNDANKAAELLGKRYKLFTDKTETNSTETVVFVGGDDVAE